MKAEELRRKFEGIVLGEDANGEPVGMTDVELDECMKFAGVYKEQQIKELKEYAQHKRGCKTKTDRDWKAKCDCGFDKLNKH